MGAHRELAREGKEEEGEDEAGGVAWGRHGELLGGGALGGAAAAAGC
jgi:hypothetical protein